jgi:hypothetical protein
MTFPSVDEEELNFLNVGNQENLQENSFSYYISIDG